MTGRSFSFSFGTSSNPLVQILSLLVFAVLLVAALIMGAFVIAVLLGFAVIAALVFAVRVWWLKRKYGARPPFDGGPAPPRTFAVCVEAHVAVAGMVVDN